MLKILRFPLLLVALALSYPVAAVDIEKGKEINGTCAACHSDNGQGGKKGEYPRIAGQQVKYLETQLRNFRSRTRVNIPMFPLHAGTRVVRRGYQGDLGLSRRHCA